MPSEEQTLTNASVETIDGKTVMTFTKPLVEPDQIPITPGVNNMLWANGGASTTIGYHGPNRSPFSLNLNFNGSSSTKPAPSLKVGDEICTTGFIMDTFCIDRGTLLDAPDVVTLKNPDLHSFHCMFDVDVCIGSGYQVLGEKDPSTGEYCLGYRLEETDKVVAAGRTYGTTTSQSGFNSCTTCTGMDDNPIAGYLATVKGTIKELGDGSQSVSGQPLLTNIQMLDASEKCATPAPQTVCLAPPDGASPTPGTPSAGEKAPTADCSSVTCETTLTDGYTLRYKLNNPDAPDGTVTMELTYDGDAWLGIAFSEDEKMGGSDGILGSPGGIPQKYRLFQGYVEIMPPDEQTLTDASVETIDGKTVMTFTKPMVEPNQIPVTAGVNNMLWANGGDSTTIGYHGNNRAPIQIDLASGAADTVSAPNMGAWLAHGICAFIAWGVLAPSAVNAAIYRSLFKAPLWFKIHQFANGMAFSLTVVAFAIAVAFINKEGNPHFFSSHAKMGLSMFIIASVQVLWGAARPHLPDPDSGDEKTAIRKVWEIKHRLTGTVLLACGFWQMSAGIKLYAGKYNGVGSVQEQGVTIAYWIWIGIEVALLLIGGVYFKLLRKPAEDGGNDAANAAASVEEDKSPTQEKDDDAV